jgi:hypothetical protein
MFNHFINLNIKIKHCLNKSQVYFAFYFLKLYIEKLSAEINSDAWL